MSFSLSRLSSSRFKFRLRFYRVRATRPINVNGLTGYWGMNYILKSKVVLEENSITGFNKSIVEILFTSECTTKNLEVLLSEEYPTKTTSTILGPIFFLLDLGIPTLARHPHILK